jgi:hypothetical protein
MGGKQILCPSSVCREGAILIGIVMSDGQVAFSSSEIVVNKEFVQIARRGRTPEKRFRFAGTCAKNGCRQWTGARCGVIDSLTESSENLNVPIELPDCSIRSQCRWFYQLGADACSICPKVITDLLGESAEASA